MIYYSSNKYCFPYIDIRAAIEGGDLGLCHLSISEISKMCHLSILAFRAKKGTKTVKNGGLRRFGAILRPKFSCGAFGAAKSRFFQFFGPKNVSFIDFWSLPPLWSVPPPPIAPMIDIYQTQKVYKRINR